MDDIADKRIKKMEIQNRQLYKIKKDDNKIRDKMDMVSKH